MITISGVHDIDFNQYDEVWYITNNNPSMRVGAIHHPELAPPRGPYTRYRNGEITLQELLSIYENLLWAGRYDEAVNNLIQLSDSGKWIQLVCYCKVFDECHRSRLYEYLSSKYSNVCTADSN